MLVIILDIADAKMDKTTLILTDLHCGGPEIAKKKKKMLAKQQISLGDQETT